MESERATSGPDDEELIRAFQADPEGTVGRAAVATLMARWRGRVYLWAYRVLKEREAALDAAQDALTQVYVALPGYEARGRFSAWLFTIVRHRCLNAVRVRPLTRDPELDTDDLQSTLPGPERAYETTEAEARILEAMNTALDPTERVALWLRSFEGLGVDEITRMLHLEGASGARGVLQTARRKLRAALATAGEER